MTDHSIRRLTIAEEADAAASRAAATGERQPNPHAGTPEEAQWKVAYERYLVKHTAPEAEEGA